MRRDRIVIATIGQPSTNPRMLKEVEALVGQGYEVKVLYCYWAAWGVITDQPILEAYPGVFHMVGGDPVNNKATYQLSRIVFRAARILARFFPIFKDYAINRPCFHLTRALSKEKADLYIAHTVGCLPAVVKASKKWGKPCGFDAEDYHRGQFESPSGEDYTLTIRTEEKYLSLYNYVTAASPLIAAAYQPMLPGKKIAVVNNVFSSRYLQPLVTKNDRPLRLLWFSQSLGKSRGLETIVQALDLLKDRDIRLSLIGDCPAAFKDYLTGLTSCPEKIDFLPPIGPGQLFATAAGYHIGLAAEVPTRINSDVALANKLFTYLLAGNCILASNTKAQQQFLEENPGIGFLYKYDDPRDLAARIADLYDDPNLLQQARDKAHQLGANRYNWEIEQKTFLEQVRITLEKNQT